MFFTRLPKTTRWIVFAAGLFFILLTLYRLVMYSIFSNLFAGAKPGILQAFVLGAAFDARIVAVIIFIIYALSFWPGIHFFKNSAGKKLALGLFGFAIMLVHLFYMADLVYLKCFQERLSGAIIPELAKNTPKGRLFLGKIEWLPMIAVLVLVTWVVIFLMAKVHKLISNERSVAKTGVRTTWHSIVFVLCIIGIYGSFSTRPLSRFSVEKNYNRQAVQIALSAPESFFSSMPIPSTRH